MLDRFKISTKGRYCLSGGEDVLCLADVSATDFIELRRLTDGPLPRQSDRVICYFEGDQASEAVVADLSMTGAALLLDERPQVGATVTVGKRYATVVRHTPEGVGVAFRMPFGPLTFNERVIL